jgi:hypothetical protein
VKNRTPDSTAPPFAAFVALAGAAMAAVSVVICFAEIGRSAVRG